MTYHRAIGLGVLIALASTSLPALAQGPGGGGMAVLGALCGTEIERFCAATPRGPAAWVCLNAHEKDLSDNCRAVVEGTGPDMGPGMGPVARLCMSEIAAHCAGIEHGSGLVRQCLENSRAKISDGCRVALDNTGWGRRRFGPQ